MNIKLIAFGIAKDILKSSQSDVAVSEGASLGELRAKVTAAYPEFEKLSSLRFAINEDYQEDDYVLNPNDEVVVIPPVSGG